ncbi:hypothetical protein E6O75_ATG02055 [Venturia nashicola]|uniref:Uncharacterized protein n=1 Tax=Venturia nashicola TaxID=86259 RepID=A0A4Z1PCZ1_9PEZI|nr:hypothetical protein E6O75_ATG02055 [Venturia nashicola]
MAILLPSTQNLLPFVEVFPESLKRPYVFETTSTTSRQSDIMSTTDVIRPPTLLRPRGKHKLCADHQRHPDTIATAKNDFHPSEQPLNPSASLRTRFRPLRYAGRASSRGFEST